MLFGPLLFPIARAVGVREVHYAMIIILAMGIGLFAPPFGVGYYAACAICALTRHAACAICALTRHKVLGRSGATCWRSWLELVIVAMFPWISIGFL